MSRDFAEDKKVKRFKLEIECEQHPDIYYHWAELSNKAKVEMDQIEARVELQLRKAALDNKGNFEDGIKATADAVEAAVNCHPEVVEAKQAYATLSAAKASMEHKKSEIDNLVKLWIAGYYSDPGRQKSPVKDGADSMRKNLNKDKE